MQVGRPQISGVTVQPFTYTGCKVTDWEFSCSDNQIAQLKCTVDAQTELTVQLGTTRLRIAVPGGEGRADPTPVRIRIFDVAGALGEGEVLFMGGIGERAPTECESQAHDG